MAKPVEILKKILANSKTRMIFIVASAVVLFIVIVVIIRAFRGNDMVNGAAAVAPVPGSIQSEPGVAQQNDKYLQTLLQSNQEQARSAIQAGQTEIPTLVPTTSSANSNNFNAQGLPAAQPSAPCCCQQCVNAAATQTNDAGGVIAQMENAGQISPVLAGQLKQLQAEGMSPDEYQKRLQALVQSGQLTPDQAQKLYDAYNAAYKNKPGTNVNPDDLVNQLASSGNIDAATAAAIKALNAQNLSPDDYAAKINDLVKAGKLSAADAQKLISAYNASKGAGATGQGPMDPDALANQMAADGSIGADTAQALKDLNSQGLTPDQYAAKLNDLVKAGKLTPDQARKLLAAYAASKAGSGATGPTPDQVVDQLGVSPDTAAALKALNKEGLSAGDYLKRINAMVKEGKLTPDQAKQLLNAYEQKLKAQQQANPSDLIGQMLNDGSISPDTANQLGLLGSRNLSPGDYKNELDKLVAAGKLTPAQAKLLFDAYTRQRATGGTNGEAALAALSAAQQEQSNEAANQALEDEQAQLAAANQQAMQAEVQAMQAAVSSQAGKLFSSWNVSTQSTSGQFVDAAPKGGAGAAAGQNAAGAGGAAQASPLVIRAGDVMFGVLDTAVNSDEPGPVMATVVSGKYKGAKLLGGLSLTSDQNGVVLSFTKMTMPDWPAAVSISAVAISPETARTALADNVNHHYFMRYGSVFASSFLQGVGQAIQQSGQTQVNNAGTSTSTFANLSIGQQAMVGLGQVGQNMGNAAQNIFNTPNTVTIKSGSGLGILFQNDVSLAAVQSATPESTASSSSNIGTNTNTMTNQKNESTFATGEQSPVTKTQ